MADTQQVHGVSEPIDSVPSPAPAAAPMRNGLGVAAFIVGVVGLVAAVIPFYNLFAGPFAVMGLVFGIVALRMKNRSRGFAIAGTTVSSGGVFISLSYVVALLLVPAVGVGTPDPNAPVQGIGPTVSAGDGAPGSIGTRENPVPIGTTVTVDSVDGTVDWEVTLGPPMLDADDVLAAYSESNEPAPEGFQYAMVPVSVLYLGTETGTPWAELGFDFVSQAGTAHSSSDSFAVAPQPLTDLNRLAPREGGTGNVVVAVPDADVKDGIWVVSTMLGDQYFFTAE